MYVFAKVSSAVAFPQGGREAGYLLGKEHTEETVNTRRADRSQALADLGMVAASHAGLRTPSGFCVNAVLKEPRGGVCAAFSLPAEKMPLRRCPLPHCVALCHLTVLTSALLL